MAGNLKLSRLRLKNWKNFQDVDVAIGDRMFLVGPNASGKSNLLDAVRFLHELASSGGFAEAVHRRGGMSALRCLASRRHADVEIHVDLKEGNTGRRWTYELSCRQDNHRRPLVCRERVLRDAAPIIDRPDEADRNDADRLTQTCLEQVNVNLPFRGLAKFFASIRSLCLVPQLVRQPERSGGRSSDPCGSDFLDQVARTTERTRRARLELIQKALRAAVPQLEAIALTHDGRGLPHLQGRYEHWRSQGTWQTEEQFSDGTLRLMGLIWAALENGGPLLIEEPELSLHPDLVRLLPQMLAHAQRRTGRQIFLSTHSPELLRDEGIGLDETFLLRPGTGGTQVTPAASFPDARQLLADGLSLADVVIPRTRPQNAEQLALLTKA